MLGIADDAAFALAFERSSETIASPANELLAETVVIMGSLTTTQRAYHQRPNG